jgi:glycosyltransferase involved in cell wall biosynthesis
VRILIDGYNIALEHGTGIATYGRNLVATAHALGHEVGVLYGVPGAGGSDNLLNEIAVVEGQTTTATKRTKWRRWRAGLASLRTGLSTTTAVGIHHSGQVIVPPSRRLASEKAWITDDIYRRAIGLYRSTGVASRVAVTDVDLAHWTYPLPIEARGVPNIYTLHDLVPLRLPYTTADHKTRYYSLCKRIAERADHIVTVSEASRRDIIEILGVSEDRVTNTYQSINMEEMLRDVGEDAIQAYVEGLIGVDFRGYFLFFGAIEPKKNVTRLLEAYLGSGVRTPLVIVGAPGWGGEAEVRMLSSLRARDRDNRIVWLDYLPRDMLAKLIAGAKATLFPSLYEGFGLPVAESMAIGTPVLTSNTSSMPEVAGDAGLLVDPYDTKALSEAIRKLDADEGLRAEMSQRGKLSALRFSPQAYRERLDGFYRRFA